MGLIRLLQVGDRVRVLRQAKGLSKDMEGAIVRILPSTDCYDVYFEHSPWPLLVYGGDLGLIGRKPADGQI